MTIPRLVRRRFILVLLIGALASAGGCAELERAPGPPPPPPAVSYLERLRAGVESSRRQMPRMIESATVAAKRVRDGGRLYVAASQPEFSTEMIGRAGGLAMTQQVPSRPDLIERNDVILYAARSALTNNDRLRIDRWHASGAYVVAFASQKLSDLRYFRPDALIDSGDEAGLPLDGEKLVPTDAVLNLVNAWAWTGEFVAACTRLGAMPVVYEAEHLDGGAERRRWYAGSTVHPDLTVPPVATGVLRMAYLDQIEQALSAVEQESAQTIHFAGVWVHDASPVHASAQLAAPPLWPDHFNDPRAPKPFDNTVDGDAAVPPTAQVSLVIGHHAPPNLAVAAAHLRRAKLIYSSVERAADDKADYILFIPSHRPKEDACVRVSGYDIPILPAGSVMQAAVYWAIVAETYPRTTTIAAE